mmetsp:Transcript_14793/g.21119  ORF Transcript_14793/g.21119 Transcript_14793/m.21119 type:complete len:125 (+) Transcript_14793:277-651(+)
MDNNFSFQGLTMFVGFVLSPFLGKKLATDPSYRTMLPKWYDFTVTQEKGTTREEFQEMFIELQKELHERAIRGEFSPENWKKIDWYEEATVSSSSTAAASLAAEQGWDKVHPLDDEDLSEESDE